MLPTGPVETPGDPLAGPPLGFPRGPEDLLVDEAGGALRIDKAFSWDAPLAAHGMMHMLIRNAWAGDPYPIDTLFMFMANMSWNSSMNTTETMRMLTDKDARSAAVNMMMMMMMGVSPLHFSDGVPQPTFGCAGWSPVPLRLHEVRHGR